MNAFEIGHLRHISGFDQRLVARAHQLDKAAAQNALLAEEVGLAFLLEAGLDDAGAAAADGTRIGERDLQRVAGGVLLHGHQAGHAAAAHIFRAHGVARALGRDHENVEIGARLDQLEMDVEAVGEGQGRPLLHVGGEIIAIELGLQFVRRHHHHDISPFRGVRRRHDLELGAFRLGGAGRSRPERDPDLAHAAVAQVLRMGVALAAIADDDHLLALHQVHVGITVIVNAHRSILSSRRARPAAERAVLERRRGRGNGAIIPSIRPARASVSCRVAHAVCLPVTAAKAGVTGEWRPAAAPA